MMILRVIAGKIIWPIFLTVPSAQYLVCIKLLSGMFVLYDVKLVCYIRNINAFDLYFN